MSQWVINGIRTGIKTTAYPARPETAAGVSPGLPVGGDYPANEIASLIARCPTRVFSESDGRIDGGLSPLHSLLPLCSRHGASG